MKKIETDLKDCYILEPDIFGDERGYFMEFYSSSKIEENNLSHILPNVIQGNRSLSKKGTLRGLHFQMNPKCQTKLVECLDGAVLDVVVDLRKSSPSYKKWIAVELTKENHRQLLVPRGFAHGFLTLKDNTLFQYLVDQPYAPELEDGFAWNDPDIGIEWNLEKYGINEPILSQKDINRNSYKESKADFE